MHNMFRACFVATLCHAVWHSPCQLSFLSCTWRRTKVKVNCRRQCLPVTSQIPKAQPRQAACPTQPALPMPQGLAPLHDLHATTPASQQGLPIATVLTTHNLPALLAEEDLSEGGGNGLPSVQALFPPIDDDIPEEVQHQVGRLAYSRTNCAELSPPNRAVGPHKLLQWVGSFAAPCVEGAPVLLGLCCGADLMVTAALAAGGHAASVAVGDVALCMGISP